MGLPAQITLTQRPPPRYLSWGGCLTPKIYDPQVSKSKPNPCRFTVHGRVTQRLVPQGRRGLFSEVDDDFHIVLGCGAGGEGVPGRLAGGYLVDPSHSPSTINEGE